MEITNYELRITNYGLRITDYGLRITDYELRITNYGLRIIFCEAGVFNTLFLRAWRGTVAWGNACRAQR